METRVSIAHRAWWGGQPLACVCVVPFAAAWLWHVTCSFLLYVMVWQPAGEDSMCCEFFTELGPAAMLRKASMER